MPPNGLAIHRSRVKPHWSQGPLPSGLGPPLQCSLTPLFSSFATSQRHKLLPLILGALRQEAFLQQTAFALGYHISQPCCRPAPTYWAGPQKSSPDTVIPHSLEPILTSLLLLLCAVCNRVYVYVHACARLCVWCMGVCACMCVYAWSVCLCVHICVFIHVCTCMCVCVVNTFV